VIFHVLTVVLVLLKVLGVVQISWWLAVAPSIVVVVWAVTMIVGLLLVKMWADS
jgi:hypothetical protein